MCRLSRCRRPRTQNRRKRVRDPTVVGPAIVQCWCGHGASFAGRGVRSGEDATRQYWHVDRPGGIRCRRVLHDAAAARFLRKEKRLARRRPTGRPTLGSDLPGDLVLSWPRNCQTTHWWFFNLEPITSEYTVNLPGCPPEPVEGRA